MCSQVAYPCGKIVVKGSKQYINAVYASLHPDNTKPAPRMKISEVLEEDTYVIEICVSNNLLNAVRTLRSTIDELLGLLEVIDSIEAYSSMGSGFMESDTSMNSVN
ncbi:KEOPS complex subunit Pcc1 [Desulfurococcus amylolyticus]|uniref:Transcription factor Pcc1 n=1 Tax=Desulfurococcus amylolyticus DSM 16532 TaxID=768672 RepID=I3XTM2_DESAM|nr:KEOPS complex subunit Pcc1 [Desulfurococcus amylolyticus]AFL67296.1 hypothetical protein Desfe_1431 [Desulfurococcus amylolyticus DSM 16532]